MRKKRTVMIRLLSLLLALVLLSVPTAALAQESERVVADTQQVILLENGDKIVISAEMTVSTRSVNMVTKTRWAKRFNSKDELLCSFTLEGVFNSATGGCISTSHIISSPNGTWRVEDAKTWRDAYTAYGSANFVKRVLGIKVNSESIKLEVSY